MRVAGAVFVGATFALSACASILGIESVAYDGIVDGGDGSVETTVMPSDASDANATDSCSGARCGARCCEKGATCIDAGVCSTDVVSVSGGGTASCAVLADGRVYCWGASSLGQIGAGDAGDDTCTFFFGPTTSVDEPCRWHPTRVENLPPARSVAAGGQLACAVAIDGGSVWCWGRNAAGTLGHDPLADPTCSDFDTLLPDGAPEPVRCSSTPSAVAGIANAVELAVGTDTVCARTAAGDVLCWGEGGKGERGDGEGGARSVPSRVVGLPAGDPIVQIATPLFVPGTCAVSASGHAWCWGQYLALENAGPTASPVTGGTADALRNLSEIRPAVGYICARRNNGFVSCWGRNGSGDLGRGDCDAGDLPENTVVGLPKNVGLDARWSHTCALDEGGTVRCWGLAQNGALGVNEIAGDPSCALPGIRATPAIVPNLPPMAQVATGIETTFAITTDGKLWAWGANDLGRIGHEPNTGSDLINCGTGNKTICDPIPKPVAGLPPP